MKNAGLLLLFLFLRIIASAQEDPTKYLIDSLVRAHHVKEMRIDEQTVSAILDTTRWIETRSFDARGNKIQSLTPNWQGGYIKRINLYDSLNRRILYREYDEKDTTIFHNETKWVYTDSTHYRKESYHEGNLTETNTYLIKTSGDTTWVTEDEHSLTYNRRDHSVSRFRLIGDTLHISEYIEYDDSLRMKDIKAYYRVKRDLDTGYLFMSGTYIVQLGEWEQFIGNDSLIRDYYMNPDKYIQMQLDGKFAYEYDEEPHSYRLYNYKHQLLQNGQYSSKSTYTYNKDGQLTMITRWGVPEYDYSSNKILEIGHVFYEYNDKGLPIKVTTENASRRSGSTHIIHYTYSY